MFFEKDSNSFKNEILLEKTDSCKSKKSNFAENLSEIQINCYSNDSKKMRGHAKIKSCSHDRSEELKNKMLFKSNELKEILEIINNQKKIKEQNSDPKQKKTDSFCCGFNKCKIF